MLNSEDLLAAIKQAAMDAVRASKPADVVTGTIVNLNPLTIQIDQKTLLTENFLIVPHEIRGKLKEGPVVLIQKQGGQRFVVLGTL